MLPIKEEIAKNALIKSPEEYQRLYEESLADPVAFWRKQGEALTWFHPFHSVRDIDH